MKKEHFNYFIETRNLLHKDYVENVRICIRRTLDIKRILLKIDLTEDKNFKTWEWRFVSLESFKEMTKNIKWTPETIF